MTYSVYLIYTRFSYIKLKMEMPIVTHEFEIGSESKAQSWWNTFPPKTKNLKNAMILTSSP